MPLWPEPSADAAALEQQGGQRPQAKAPGSGTLDQRVYAEDWWAHARPVFELHGYFRVRTQLFHRFNLGRVDPPGLRREEPVAVARGQQAHRVDRTVEQRWDVVGVEVRGTVRDDLVQQLLAAGGVERRGGVHEFAFADQRRALSNSGSSTSAPSPPSATLISPQ